MAEAEHGQDARPGAEVLAPFSAATRDWFTGAFAAPTPAQAGAWAAAGAGEDALVVAPTGSGKTLAAFLWSLDRLAAAPVPEDRRRRCRVLYVSPLKALAVDVERNLRSPLVGIRRSAVRLGLPEPVVRVAVRSGDTPADERRAFLTDPADVLITTPESLFLLLTSRARESLAGVETVILDEVHAVAGTKRGAHLAVSLDRLDALLERPAQRIGLSATVRPVQEVARFLSGGRPVRVVQPPAEKQLELSVVVPVADMSSIGESTGEISGSAAGEEKRTSIWPHIHERVVDLVAEHTSTLVFANSRRLAERFTAQLNERWAERTAPGEDDGDEPAGASPARPPAQVMGQSGSSSGAPVELARAHHGSVSKEQRAIIEEELKAGRLPAVVATSSLELGIDMGAIDLVVQVESPPSVASGLQRIGRAGHHVGAVSRGIVFPKHRSDLVQAAVVVERMATGDIEAVKVPANPLDVLAQQVVAMCAMDDWPVEQLFSLVRRSAAFSGLGRATFEATLDMLAGRYPSEEFAELRPRIVWDRVADTLTGRPGAQRLAVTSGGTIPDRGLFGVFLAGSQGAGRRVGELDEEMVYETRVGDVITLGSSSWRVEDITRDQVLVTPAPGQPGRLPFWHGDGPGRPAELGRALGAFVRELVSASPAAARRRALDAGLDDWAADNLLAYLAEQKEATGLVPDDRTVVVERFRDELGDWRVCVHSPFGAQVHAPWALVLAARFRERHGIDVQAMHGDDGIVLRLPDIEVAGWGGTEPAAGGGEPVEPAWPTPAAVGAFDVADTVVLEADEVEDVVTAEIGGSALFAARFRECAARALLLPRRTPERRQPLWQQRQRSASLLEVASRYPAFPIVLETVRECLQDVFDVPGLVALMRGIAAREVRVVEVESAIPSPYARSLMFGYVAQFLYEGDSPLAERRAAALSLDPQLLAELLGRGEGASLRDLLEPESVQRTEAELQRLVHERHARHAEDLADLLRTLGPLSTAEVQERSTDPAAAPQWLDELVRVRRAIEVRVGGDEQWAAVEDAGRLRDALGAALPVGVPDAFLELSPDPLADLLARFARTRGPFPASAAAARFGLGVAVVNDALRRLEQAGRLTSGQLRPLGAGGQLDALDFCDAQVLRTLRRRSLAALRSEVEPVTPEDYARFLPAWQGVDLGPGTGRDPAGNGTGGRARRGGRRGGAGVVRAGAQLTGAQVPASALETLVLPARVLDYSPAMLDELTAAGEVVWTGHGSIGSDDGWVSLHLADSVHLTVRPPPVEPAQEPTAGSAAGSTDAWAAGVGGTGDLRRRVLDVLASGGGFFFRALSDSVGSTDDAALAEVVWDLVWTGRLTNDTVAPVRALTSGGGTHRRRPAPARARYARARPGAGARPPRLGSAALPNRSGPPRVAGRWSSVPESAGDPTLRAAAGAEVLLDRYGVVMRGPVLAEDVPGGFAGVYRVLAGMEDAGRVRRGYFVEGLGAAQFATTGAVDRLRAQAGAAASAEPRALLLAASDPANPYGAALPWPDRASAADAGPGSTSSGTGHRPGRKAGAVVVLVAGALVLYVERGGRSLLTYSDETAVLQAAADALALASRDGGLGRLTVVRTDGAPVLAVGSAVGEALEQAGFRATPRGLRIG